MERASRFSFSPDHLADCLNKCLRRKALRPGKQVHATLISSGMNTNVLSLSSKLVGMYASSGDMKSAKLVLGEIRKPNAFAFNWMIFASSFNGDFEDAISYFSLMQKMGICQNKFTFSILLKACVGLLDLNKGKEVHCVVTKMGFEGDASVGNVMVDMYCKCGRVYYARKMFDKMSQRDVACWTSMICGHFAVGEAGLANDLFEQMKSEGPEPNVFTWNAMIVGFARCGDSDSAFAMFDTMRRADNIPDSATWSAIISGFTQSHRPAEALKMFRAMLLSETRPTQVTIAGLLPICGLTGSIKIGKQLHGHVFRMSLEINAFVASALVDMYSKCGDINTARSVFDSVRTKTVPLWNAMIGCYGKHGMVDSSLQLFDRMSEEGVRANAVTLVSVLSSCSHGGLVERGSSIFRSMKERFGIEASKEHYACLVDLLCRSGKIEEAYEVVKGSPVGVTESIAGAFFHGCRVHERRDLAKMVSEDILGTKLRKPGGFVTLSNIHAGHGDWEEAQSVRKVMKEKRVHKRPGFSWHERKD